MSAEITKVTLKLGKREIEMTVEEARNLKAALEGLFGREIVKEVVREGCAHWHWGYPMYVSDNPKPISPMWEITCGTSPDTLCLSVSNG